MNIIIAIVVAIAYLALGFGVALFAEDDENFVMFYVFAWPVAIVAIILIDVVLSINKLCVAIYRRLKGRVSEQEDM